MSLLNKKINDLKNAQASILSNRKVQLDDAGEILKKLYHQKGFLRLNFICTHNSRRSVAAEVWAYVLIKHFKLENITVYSGGTEATQVKESIIKAFKYFGLRFNKERKKLNPKYTLDRNHSCFSKKYDDPHNPQEDYVGIMVCDDAYESCPIIRGGIARIGLTFKDPKYSDNTPEEAIVYQNTVQLIGVEIYYLLQKLTN